MTGSEELVWAAKDDLDHIWTRIQQHGDLHWRVALSKALFIRQVRARRVAPEEFLLQTRNEELLTWIRWAQQTSKDPVRWEILFYKALLLRPDFDPPPWTHPESDGRPLRSLQ